MGRTKVNEGLRERVYYRYASHLQKTASTISKRTELLIKSWMERIMTCEKEQIALTRTQTCLICLQEQNLWYIYSSFLDVETAL